MPEPTFAGLSAAGLSRPGPPVDHPGAADRRVHDPGAALDYARRLAALAAELSRSMRVIKSDGADRDLSCLVVSRAGQLVSTDDRWEPYRLLDGAGAPATPVAVFPRELVAAGRSQNSATRCFLGRHVSFMWSVDGTSGPMSPAGL